MYIHSFSKGHLFDRVFVCIYTFRKKSTCFDLHLQSFWYINDKMGYRESFVSIY